ncbi:MAG: hypothetical protein ACE5FH_10320 [Candidatus Zixiibacteriota bacterium]
MRLNHLTDREIQEYIDRETCHETGDIPSHLTCCAKCQQHMREYRNLYLALKDDSGFDLPPDFAATVADRATAQPAIRREIHVWTLAALGAAISAVVLLYLAGWQSLVGSALTRGKPFLAVVDRLTNLVHNQLSAYDGNINILLFAAAVLLVFSLLERLFKLSANRRFMI